MVEQVTKYKITRRVGSRVMTATWQSAGRQATQPADPNYPDGVDINAGVPWLPEEGTYCQIDLPYPAPECGSWRIECATCGLSAVVTAAGRADDPRTFRVMCKAKPNG